MSESSLFESIDQFIHDQFSRDDEHLEAVAKSLVQASIQNISVSSPQGKFLHLLAKFGRAKKILEIGTLGGYSTIWMARALPPTGKLISLEVDAMHAQVARDNIARAGLGRIVDIRIGDAAAALRKLISEGGKPFDMIFIDADKVSYEKYFKLSLKLVHSGSLIIADNVIRRGAVLDPANADENARGISAFLKTLSASRAVSATVLQTVGAKGHDGMAIAVVN